MQEEQEEVEQEEEEETVTEVEVSEKTLKFKIATEGSITAPGGRRSYPGSRKGSREKAQLQDYHHNVHDLVRAIHDQEEGGAFRDLCQTSTFTPTSPSPHSKDFPFISPSPDKDQRHGSSEDSELQSVVMLSSLGQASGRKVGELCNGETKCFEGVKRQTSEDQQVQVDDNNLEADCGVIGSDDHDAPHDDKEARAISAKKTTLLMRIRNLTDRLSFSNEKHSAEPTHGYCNKSSPVNKLDDSSSTSVNSADTRSVEEAANKAMTLPKTRKPQRTDSGSTGKRGWKVLVGGGGKDRLPSSSLELLSPAESSSPDVRQQRDKKNALRPKTEELQGQETQNSNGLEASCNVSVDQDDSWHMADSSPASAKSDSAVLSGSLDSILKEKDRSSGNNNIRKKINIWSSPGSKHGFFTRLGRSNTHTEGTRRHGSEDNCSKVQQHNWMSSLAAGFRPKKNHHHRHHHHSLHKPQGQE
ncbi:uncharacterized protein LOC110830355 [Zootermopsis nevadensis]|uniref:Uncharacterized protein n=1 Tax=Zootermopsis nevadensis TaxID=136037 RepID=A0A067R6P5_ZOONE|nr:uncharacterized protein LOC110830355 [Zootermopsis nevadensis]KDR18979.1 hypothetical protein L798_05858 [Zootermopsis nevadensis]